MSQNNKSMIFIYNDIIRNKELSSSAFCLYVQLTFLCRGSPVKIHKSKLMEYLYIKDNRTLKKCLQELYDLGLLKEQYTTMPKFKPLILTPLRTVTKNSSKFTMLPSTLLIERLEDIGHIGFRLMYYWESFINRQSEILYSKTPLRVICNDLGIGINIITKYSEILRKHKLLKIEKHHIFNVSYDEDDKPEYLKFCNYYYVLINKL